MCKRRDFSKALIYLLYDPSGEYSGVYVGSTALPLEKRIEIHTKSFQCYVNGTKGYRHIRAYDVMTNAREWVAKVLEEYPCADERELFLREAHWINVTPNTVNRHVPLHTPEGKKIAHKKAVLKYDAKHREEKRIRSNQKFACHCSGKYTMANRRQHWRSVKHQTFVDTLRKISRERSY